MTEAIDKAMLDIELSPEAGAMLIELTKAEGLSARTIIDRAIQVYFRVMEIECAGKDLMVVARGHQHVDLLRFE